MFYEFKNFGSADYLKKELNVDFSFPKHLHQCFELIIIKSGEMIVTVDDKCFTMHENDAILIFPNQVHSLSSTKSEHILFIFSPFIVNAFYKSIAEKIPVNALFQLKPHMIDVLSELENDSPLIEKKGVLYYVCSLFAKEARYVQRPYKSEPVYEMFAYVEKNYSKECTMQNAAASLGYNYAYLSKLFKKTVGMTYNEYVNLVRLNNTCYLMETTDMTVMQCAFLSGYRSMHTFNRNFKDHYGKTPTEYRKVRA